MATAAQDERDAHARTITRSVRCAVTGDDQVHSLLDGNERTSHGHRRRIGPLTGDLELIDRGRKRLARETWIGVGALALAVAAMAVDHLFGNDPESDDAFPVDPAAFVISVGISVLLAAFLFGRVVPRAKARDTESERTAMDAVLCSALALVTGLGFLWLGFPLVLAGGGIALGLLGRQGQRRRIATTAVVLGAVVVVLGVGSYFESVARNL